MKYRLLILLPIILFVFSGCSSKDPNIVECRNTEIDNDEKLVTIVEAKLEEEKVVSINGKLEFDNENSLNSFYNLINIRNELSEISYDYGLKIDGNDLIINNYQYMFTDYLDGENSLVLGMSKDDYIKMMTDKKFTCE